MKKYLVTSNNLEGDITFGYNDSGFLCSVEVNTTNLTDEQIKWIWQRLEFMYKVEDLQVIAEMRKWKLSEVSVDLSFSAFWNLYGLKRNKQDSERLWNTFKDSKRVQVLNNVKAYNRYCARNASWYNKLYPDNYLLKHTEDEWDKI